MKILITNNRLDLRGGAEMFVRDLARALQARGHVVFAYSSDLGEGERLLESDVVAVSTDLEKLPFQPDIIHAQHHLDAMTALTALPGVPAIYHCHGAVWREAVPKHPRICHYLAMSRTLAERIMVESNIAADDITLWWNTVDTARFHTVRKLPTRPARALFFNNRHSSDGETVAAVREAALRCGIELDFIGNNFAKKIYDPERVLPEYDLVFASGKCAIDAMASGCAVIVVGRTSCGEMIRPESFERLREVNFSCAVNSPPPSAEKIENEIRRFSADDSAKVTERLRREADLDSSIDRLLAIYDRVRAQHSATAPDSDAESRAVSHYLRRLVPVIKELDRAQTLGHSVERNAEKFP